ncbi:hypothetical protein, partial [Streptomyces sp. P17]|uniref:hypothetical protein n=1 Tax=Streptomyces sp. P17 TaxID=3074716 RepID=UPI0028F45313
MTDDPRPEWVEAGVAALVAEGCAERGSTFIRDNVYVDGAVTVTLAAVIDQIKAEALMEAATAYQLGGMVYEPQARGDLATKRQQAEHAVA